MYETGSMFLDVMILMDIDTARGLMELPSSQVSCFYVEAADPSQMDEVAARIEAAVKRPRVDARSMKACYILTGSVLVLLVQIYNCML